ncbi:MAG: S8 family serine peptidase [Gammaproteobacteria bacterium]
MVEKTNPKLALAICVGLVFGGRMAINSLDRSDTSSKDSAGLVSATLVASNNGKDADSHSATLRADAATPIHALAAAPEQATQLNIDADATVARNHWNDLDYGTSPNDTNSDVDNARSQASLTSFDVNDGMVDMVLAFNDRAEMIDLAERVAAAGGTITKDYERLAMSGVRIPAFAADEFAANAGALSAVDDRQVRFLSNSARKTAQLPTSNSLDHVDPDNDIVLAVIDSGVANHQDINLVGRVNIIQPATEKTNSQYQDNSLEALFVFDELDGNKVFDRRDDKTDAPVNLVVADTSNTSWGSTSLKFNQPTVASGQRTSAIARECKNSNEMTLEAWVQPANASQAGPANIVSLTNGQGGSNFVLQQVADRFTFGVRTAANAGGEYVTSSSQAVSANMQHIVITANASGSAKMYIDGVFESNQWLGSDFSNWFATSTLSLSSANSNQVWLGEYGMLAVHCDALSSSKVSQHYNAGPDVFVTDHDPLGHGTHVAGIAGGNGTLSAGAYPGMAPDAQIFDVRVLRHDGRGTVSDVLAGLDWVLANHDEHNIRVINMSLGKAVESSVATDPLVLATEAVWDAGVVVVASAGNYGKLGYSHITSPGNSPKIITVGSVTDRGTVDPSDDYVSSYSSLGPTGIDRIMKPDLLAPGNRFIAPISDHAHFKTALHNAVPNCGGNCTGKYLEMSGTSMAAGVVSGAAVLLLSKDNNLNASTVKARLMRSANKLDIDPIIAGAGVLDVQAALNESGSVTQAPSPRMIPSADGSGVMIEDTAQLWGGAQWGASALWESGAAWNDTPSNPIANSFLWSDSYLWSDSFLWSDSTLEDDSMSESL